MLEDSTVTRNERAMIFAALHLLDSVLDCNSQQTEIHSHYPQEPREMAPAQLIATLSALPPNATVKLDADSGKFDVYVGDQWIGGIWLAGDEAGKFYAGKPPACHIYPGGKYAVAGLQ